MSGTARSRARDRDLDPAGFTVAAVRDGLFSGSLSAEEVTLASLRRIEAVNARYNAIILRNGEALETARNIDRRRASGERLGPLAGVPVVVKDTIDMVGFPSTAGCRLLCSAVGGIDLLPSRDSAVVTRLRDAGAVVLGKTNVPVLSASGAHANNSWAGPTLNAVAEDRVPGGSSAGTATAVAAHMCVVGLGAETGGSIQNPASAQGLVGVTPTVGLVPNTGVVPLSSMRDVVGPIARNVRDAAVCLDVIAGFTMDDPKTLASVGLIPAEGYAARLSVASLKGKKIGLFGPGWRIDEPSPETAGLYAASLDRFRAAGAVLVEDPFRDTGFASHRRITPGSLGFDGRGMESVAYDIHCYLRRLGPGSAIRTWQDFAEVVKQDDPFAPGAVLGYLHCLPDFAAAMKEPELPPAMDEFVALRTTYLALMDDVFSRHRLDALVYPQMLYEIPGLFSGVPIAETTVSELNIAGIPGVTVPAGVYRSGAPFGLIFLGPRWSEASLLALAFAYEQSL